MSRNQEQGEGKIKAIVVTLILAMIGYSLFQIAPAFMSNYWIKDAMVNEARVAAVNHKSEAEVREVIWKVVQEQQVKSNPPLRMEDIRVEYMGRSVNISMKYVVPIDLYFYKFDLEFTPNAGDRPII